MNPHGWIILDKPLGLGSTQAVGAAKRILRDAGFGKVKVGHGGTLDPLATGVLPIAIGEATKLAGRMLDASKIYDFTIGFGTETDSLDSEGTVVARSDHRPTRADVEAVLAQFTGPIEQVPPAYSALKIDGKRAYDRARAGELVEMKPRAVDIYSLKIRHPETVAGSRVTTPDKLKHLQDGALFNEITLTAYVSKGTYIRSLARDIARALGTVGHVTMLRRTKAGPFTLKQAISLDKLNEIGQGAPIESLLLPLEAALDDIPAVRLLSRQAGQMRSGQKLAATDIAGCPTEDGRFLALDEHGFPLALAERSDDLVIVVRGFNIATHDVRRKTNDD
ncbi:MAG: tRNA pseudouridine(55) synthase TruB [Parasphingorhabdus sp.]|nr:tRNA pseudouridine(55) synthase TruB [Parasphingorhabdus sp.]